LGVVDNEGELASPLEIALLLAHYLNRQHRQRGLVIVPASAAASAPWVRVWETQTGLSVEFAEQPALRIAEARAVCQVLIGVTEDGQLTFGRAGGIGDAPLAALMLVELVARRGVKLRVLREKVASTAGSVIQEQENAIAMQPVVQRLSSLRRLLRPLALTFIGIVLLSLGVAYFFIFVYRTATLPPMFSFITLQFLPLWARGLVFAALGLIVLAVGIWQLSGVAVISLDARDTSGEVVLAYQRDQMHPRMTVISGGAGLLITASLGRTAQLLTCITPVQDPVEYYYRASSLFNFENVVFVVPTLEPHEVFVELDDGQRFNIKHNIAHDERLAQRHVVNIYIGDEHGPLTTPLHVTQVALDAIASADVIVFGPAVCTKAFCPTCSFPTCATPSVAVRRAKSTYAV
jgi:hypothetical protein